MANRVRFNVLATLLCAVQVFSSCLLVTEHPVYVRREAGHNGGGIDAEISQDATVSDATVPDDGNTGEDRTTPDTASDGAGTMDGTTGGGNRDAIAFIKDVLDVSLLLDGGTMRDAAADSDGFCVGSSTSIGCNDSGRRER